MHEVFVRHGNPSEMFIPIRDGNYGHLTPAANKMLASTIMDTLEAPESN